MNIIRHGKPSKAYLATLRSPSKADYDVLVKSCMEALISGEKDVIVQFSYVTKFPEGFPKGILQEKVGAVNIHRIKADKLLMWLHEQGHTEVTVTKLKQQKEMFTKFENSIDENQD